MPGTPNALPDRVMRPLAKRARKFNDSMFMKCGTHYAIQREVDTIFFIQCNTSIPVPMVIKSNIQEISSWFFMSIVPGVSLTDDWAHMSDEAQVTTQRDLFN